MADVNQQQPEKKKQGAFASLEQLPFFVKLILLMSTLGVLYFIVFGSNVSNIFSFVLNLMAIGIVAMIFLFIFQHFFGSKEAKSFSPKELRHARLVNAAVRSVPPNIRGRSLVLYGNSLVQGFKFGKINGMLLLPIFAGHVKTDAQGKPLFEVDKLSGKRLPVFTKQLDPKEDFEYFFVVKHGGLLSQTYSYVRCLAKRVLSTNGDVFLDTVNLVPHMSSQYLYPFEDVQKDVTQIMNQNMIENVLITFDYFQDLIANTTDHALNYNPVWKAQERMGEERLYNPETPR